MVRFSVVFAVLVASAAVTTNAQATQQAQAIQQGPERVPQSASSVLRQAAELHAQHKLDAAAALLRAYLSQHAEDADGLTLLAQVQVDQGDVRSAQQLLVRALNASPNSPPANRMAGKMLLEARRYPEAMDRFETVLAILPRDGEARRLELDAATKLAAQAQRAGNQDAALKVFEHARTSMPDDPQLLLALGMEAFDLHRLAEADEALQAARQLSPKDPDITYGLARVEVDEQHMEAAEADLRSYLAARPGDAAAHFGLGHVLAMEQRTDAARAEFERSVQLQPVQTESYYQIGQMDLNAQQDLAAAELFRKVIERDPNHGGALVGLGEIAFREKKYAEADGYLQRATKAAPDYAPAHYYRGLVLSRLGRKVEAEQELRVATQLGHTAAAPVSSTPAGPQP